MLRRCVAWLTSRGGREEATTGGSGGGTLGRGSGDKKQQNKQRSEGSVDVGLTGEERSSNDQQQLQQQEPQSELHRTARDGKLSRDSGSIVHSLRIQLRPHVHTPACDRRERICTAMGKVRELETLEVRVWDRWCVEKGVEHVCQIKLWTWHCNYGVFVACPRAQQVVGECSGTVQGFIWLRGTAPQIDDSFQEIEGSASSAQYILQGADVGCYIGFAIVRVQGRELVSCLAKAGNDIRFSNSHPNVGCLLWRRCRCGSTPQT